MLTRLRPFLLLLFTAAVAAGCVGALGWCFSGAGRTAPTADAALAAKAEAGRDPSFTEGNQFSLVAPDQDVKPTGEPPLLAPLVAAGTLPPVADRLPSEPLVMRGVDGPGEYGGTWLRLATDPGDVSVITWRMSYATPLRWSPLGDPIVPHVAKSLTTDDGGRTWTFTLRKGHKWSDGRPFTSDDVMYWWDREVLDTQVGSGEPPWWLLNGSEVPRFERVSDTVFRVRYDTPNGLFPELMASYGNDLFDAPRHYLARYHPALGDPEFLGREMRAYGLLSPRALYSFVRQFENPRHPRLWPWVYLEHRSNPPSVFVRNPYYFAVDERGRQLPYIDRVQFDVRRVDLIPLDVAAGRVSMQARHLRFADYTEYMSRRDSADIDVLSWYNSTRSDYLLYPNLNRIAVEGDAESTWKAGVLNQRDFRKALSLAVDRDEIIRADYFGITEAEQISPGRASPYYDERLAKLNTAFDPAEAERLLDSP